jgi:hypothetical protein
MNVMTGYIEIVGRGRPRPDRDADIDGERAGDENIGSHFL